MITRALAFLILSLAIPLPALEYQVDQVHSTVLWGIQHMGLGQTWGRFNELSGTIAWDAADPAATTIAVTVKTASVDSAHEGRDKHLRAPDIFDVETHPAMTWASKGLVPVAGKEDVFTATGTLTLKGVAKEMTIEIAKLGEGVNLMSKKPGVGFEARFIIDRTEFEVGTGPVSAALGKPVQLIVALEAFAD